MFPTTYFSPTYYPTTYFPPAAGVVITEQEPKKGPHVKWWEYEQIALREDEEMIMLLTAIAEVIKPRY